MMEDCEDAVSHMELMPSYRCMSCGVYETGLYKYAVPLRMTKKNDGEYPCYQTAEFNASWRCGWCTTLAWHELRDQGAKREELRLWQ